MRNNPEENSGMCLDIVVGDCDRHIIAVGQTCQGKVKSLTSDKLPVPNICVARFRTDFLNVPAETIGRGRTVTRHELSRAFWRSYRECSSAVYVRCFCDASLSPTTCRVCTERLHYYGKGQRRGVGKQVSVYVNTGVWNLNRCGLSGLWPRGW